ncbi:hypothetical protein Mal4_52760 [Maioricimonas rarisocia]|uniref:N-acetyltransferase domain-containing protein n=1 Tax=Maioricimonas rarisocia TaxID=2528026 RepID=A0A517ZEH7_9PLAN|nr:N-acetyltransferase [Maioricimonas rarisocia]QDU40913.1 hypothetical protein Mal4_52760 [Maioricimonas rarisocia]
MNLSIRPETSQDQAGVRRVNEAAFEGTAEADLVEALHEGDHVATSLVAEVDGNVVGHILFSHLTIVTDHRRLPALSLAPMAVLPAHQKQGIGSRLVSEGLAACRDAGHQIVTVLGHPTYYPRFGFSPGLAAPLSSPFGVGEAWMAIELTPGALEGVSGSVEFAAPFRIFE